MVDHGVIRLVRKAMIRCSLILNPNGFWKIAQLFQHPQGMIQRYPMEFQEAHFSKQNFKIPTEYIETNSRACCTFQSRILSM